MLVSQDKLMYCSHSPLHWPVQYINWMWETVVVLTWITASSLTLTGCSCSYYATLRLQRRSQLLCTMGLIFFYANWILIHCFAGQDHCFGPETKLGQSKQGVKALLLQMNLWNLWVLVTWPKVTNKGQPIKINFNIWLLLLWNSPFIWVCIHYRILKIVKKLLKIKLYEI